MGNDLPDFQSQIVSASVEATSFRSGLDANKPASPAAGDIWLARDTFYLYVCFTAGSWEAVAKLYLLLTGGTMSGAIAMGTNKVTGLGNPTAAQDGATKTYVDTADALRLLLTGGTMSGAIAMGTNKVTGLDAPTANADAARKVDVDTVTALLDDVSQAQPSRAVTTIYQNSTKIRVVSITLTLAQNDSARAEVGSSSPPVTAVAGSLNQNTSSIRAVLTFIVPPSYYYRITLVVGTPTILYWTEWDLH